MSAAPASPDGTLRAKPGAWVDLGLTLPIFVAYHAGVIFLRVQNATDVITGPMLRAAEGNRGVYLLMTASIGVVFTLVFGIIGRGQAFRPAKFVQIALEGVVYAFLMRIGASYVVGRLFAAIGSTPAAQEATQGPFVGLVMSLGVRPPPPPSTRSWRSASCSSAWARRCWCVSSRTSRTPSKRTPRAT